jgi:hypothetical protein
MDTTITNWTYENGELAEKRFFNTVMIFAIIVCVIISLIYFFFLPTGNAFHLFTKTKIGGWLMIIPMLIFCVIVVIIFGVLHSIIFSLYKKLFTIKLEDISFTNNKIITAKKEWILNDDKRTLTEVKIITDKNETNLIFSGIEKNTNGTDGTFKKEIPVPDNEITKAKKIVEAFKF